MVDAKFARPCSHAARRWIATRSLDDPTRIACGIGRRPASGRTTITTTVDVLSTL
jgi:hypothetical protein